MGYKITRNNQMPTKTSLFEFNYETRYLMKNRLCEQDSEFEIFSLLNILHWYFSVVGHFHQTQKDLNEKPIHCLQRTTFIRIETGC